MKKKTEALVRRALTRDARRLTERCACYVCLCPLVSGGTYHPGLDIITHHDCAAVVTTEVRQRVNGHRRSSRAILAAIAAHRTPSPNGKDNA